MVADAELVYRKLAELKKNLDELKKHQHYTLDELREDLSKQWVVAHGLQLSIQIILDIGNHLLSDQGIRAKDYADVIDKMGENNIIPLKFAKKIRGMAGFRNIIIHGYSALDLRQVHAVLTSNLSDFTSFAGYIADYLTKNS